ncbi:hypothetical protein ACN47E_008389 [Coniothyrium glycines]
MITSSSGSSSAGDDSVTPYSCVSGQPAGTYTIDRSPAIVPERLHESDFNCLGSWIQDDVLHTTYESVEDDEHALLVSVPSHTDGSSGHQIDSDSADAKEERSTETDVQRIMVFARGVGLVGGVDDKSMGEYVLEKLFEDEDAVQVLSGSDSIESDCVGSIAGEVEG